MKHKNLPALNKKNEKGAALITTLLLSTMLLAVGGVLILTSTSTATTSIDSTAEMQAYYAAESGIQAATTALRGNLAARAPFDPATTTINFPKAVDPATSNLPTDTLGTPRLSAWLPYSYANGVADWRVPLTPANPAAYNPQADLAYSVSVSRLPGDTSAPPIRLLVRSRGYGPKGAVKQLEAVVMDPSFDFRVPASILFRGATNSDIASFLLGPSNAKTLTGHDNAGTGTIVPVFGVTKEEDQILVDAAISPDSTVVSPKTQLLTDSDLPSWIKTPADTMSLIDELKIIAQDRSRYFTTTTTDVGTQANPKLTFVDGDGSIGPNSEGAGLLVVRGTLTLNGNFNFFGLILVLGNGSVIRTGGGTGVVTGAMVVAHATTPSQPFLAPSYDSSGGGNLSIIYDSSWVRKALDAGGPHIVNVREF
ncbi:MAG TPA: hypothetical protein VK208_21260 [Pyrinomonadaceae bacterium]|nr:hypothetical protein [Pyrinomonadaceae bacterium]